MTVLSILVFGIIIINSMSAFSFEKILKILETVVTLLRIAITSFIPQNENEE